MKMKKGLVYFDSDHKNLSGNDNNNIMTAANEASNFGSFHSNASDVFPCGYKRKEKTKQERYIQNLVRISHEKLGTESLHTWMKGDLDNTTNNNNHGNMRSSSIDSNSTSSFAGPRFFDYSYFEPSMRPAAVQQHASVCELSTLATSSSTGYEVRNNCLPCLPMLIKVETAMKPSKQYQSTPIRLSNRRNSKHPTYTSAIATSAIINSSVSRSSTISLEAIKGCISIEIYRGDISNIEAQEGIRNSSSSSSLENEYISAYYDDEFSVRSTIKQLKSLIRENFQVVKQNILALKYYSPILLTWNTLLSDEDVNLAILNCYDAAVPLKIMFTVSVHKKIDKPNVQTALRSYQTISRLKSKGSVTTIPRRQDFSTSLLPIRPKSFEINTNNEPDDHESLVALSKQQLYAKILESKLIAKRW